MVVVVVAMPVRDLLAAAVAAVAAAAFVEPRVGHGGRLGRIVGQRGLASL